MTDSTTIDPGKAPTRKRRATDKPRAASTRAGFNPIHPSMELPPEQLIRLLGLEKKKPRKSRRPARKSASAPGKPTENNHSLPAELLPTPDAPAPKPASRSSHRQQEYEHARKQQPSNGSSLWKTALTAGLLLGVGASGYLFWMPSNTPGNNKTLDTPPTEVKRLQAPAVAKTPAAPIRPANRKADPAWLATVEAQAQRLREEASKRLEERLKQGATLVMPASTEQATRPETAKPELAAKVAPIPVESDPVADTSVTSGKDATTEPTAETPDPAAQPEPSVETPAEEAVAPSAVSAPLTVNTVEAAQATATEAPEHAPVDLPTEISATSENPGLANVPPASNTTSNGELSTAPPLPAEQPAPAPPSATETVTTPEPADAPIPTDRSADTMDESVLEETPAAVPASQDDLLLQHSGAGIDVAE